LLLLILNFLSLTFSPNDSLSLISTFGDFEEAVSISASREEYIFVVDDNMNQVYKFSSTGQKLANIGGSGFGNNEFNMPQSVDATNGLDVYISDYQNNRLQRFDINLSYIATFDFNLYDQTADNSKKIYRPYGVVFQTTSDIFVLADATSYRVVKLKAFDEVSLLFGSRGFGYDILTSPKKVVKGSNLDIWILDKGTDEIINFDSYGTLVKRMKNPDKHHLISIAFYKDNLYMLNDRYVIIYDLNAGKYSNTYSFHIGGNAYLTDVAMLNESNVLILSKEKVYLFQLTNSKN
jgi:hypothetical protein